MPQGQSGFEQDPNEQSEGQSAASVPEELRRLFVKDSPARSIDFSVRQARRFYLSLPGVRRLNRVHHNPRNSGVTVSPSVFQSKPFTRQLVISVDLEVNRGAVGVGLLDRGFANYASEEYFIREGEPRKIILFVAEKGESIVAS